MTFINPRLDAGAKSYLIESKRFFQKHSSGMVAQNHTQHDIEPRFWEEMFFNIGDLTDASSNLALEFGCGAGRNLVNLLSFGQFKRADGIDISGDNARNAQSYVESRFPGRSICLEGNGWSCLPLPTNTYSLILSHQVFIHIPNRSVRLLILTDMVRVLKSGGKAIIHFKSMTSAVPWEADHNKFPRNLDVTPDDLPLILKDFQAAGFEQVEVSEGENFYDGGYEIFVHATK